MREETPKQVVVTETHPPGVQSSVEIPQIVPESTLTADGFQTPDWQDHLMHVMTYVWSFPPPHIFSPMVIEVVKAEYPAGQL